MKNIRKKSKYTKTKHTKEEKKEEMHDIVYINIAGEYAIDKLCNKQ